MENKKMPHLHVTRIREEHPRILIHGCVWRSYHIPLRWSVLACCSLVRSSFARTTGGDFVSSAVRQLEAYSPPSSAGLGPHVR